MDRTISNFIRALRNADVRVSTAETLDALGAVELVGYRDKAYLKRSLATVLPKTADEKDTFDACFDQFFDFQDVRGEQSPSGSGEDQIEEQEGEDGESGDGEGGSSSGEEPKGKKKKSKSKA
jgi:hypothetical protein